MANDPADPRNDPTMMRIPFIFVKHGDPPPLRWMAEHPGYWKVPAIMVPHGAPPPWPWGGARARPAEAPREPARMVEPRIPGSFAPPPKRRKRMPGGQPWPKDKNGRDWPRDRWGRPMRPLWDYPPGVRAPGEGVAPGEPGSVSTVDAINATLRAEAVFADPMSVLEPWLPANGQKPKWAEGSSASIVEDSVNKTPQPTLNHPTLVDESIQKEPVPPPNIPGTNIPDRGVPEGLKNPESLPPTTADQMKTKIPPDRDMDAKILIDHLPQDIVPIERGYKIRTYIEI